ncbi:YcnI family copper-binding membrane protein [Nocardia sp. NBC_01327]|uniref:YcnI family copper-binding membrane protein n=1 Tax=Nocardia sp. NBC_01327 TaxID=2903593 RepID=UPI002E102620|nr:YcnI family protein [Nocardia sp. NBC_01327]
MSLSPISRTVLITALTTVPLFAATGVASAHVAVSAPGATRSGDAVLTFRVPNESSTNSATVALTVRFPALLAADTQPKPGWKSAVTKDGDGHVTAITWTADAGNGIGPGQFDQFQVLADDLPDQDRITFPAVQTYSDGEVVTWDQSDNPDGSEPERPIPTLDLAPKTSGHDTPAASDNTARWLGGIGLTLAVLALGAAGVAVRRRP